MERYYGIKALIYTPGLPPYLEGTPYQSGEDNFISVQYDDWVQTGWRYYLGWSAAHTYVEHKVGSYYGENSYEDQGWGTTIQYQVDCGNCSLSTWYAYIAGVNKGGWGPIAAPRNVLASSEIHFNWNNGLDVRFASVNYLSTNYTWQLFDQANWIEDFPYQVQKDYLYNYRTYRYSASDQVIVQLRVDQSSVANSRDYIVKIDSLSPLPNSDLSAAHSQGWLGVFLAPNSGNFTQTGFLGDRNGPRWFVYAPTLGVYCTRGITVWDRHGCLGQPYDYAALDS